MLRKTLIVIGLLMSCSLFLMTGCDPDQPGGCGPVLPEENYQEIKIALPTAEEIGNLVEKYKIELTEPITSQVIVTKEGLPGETLVFVLVDPKPRVNVKVTAFDYADVVVDVAENVVVNVDVDGGQCQVTTDVVVETATGATDVEVNVTCFGKEITDVDVDVDPTKE